MNKKNIILKHEKLFSWLYRILGRNCIRNIGKGNEINVGNAFMKHSKINISGDNNSVYIASGLTRLYKVSITIIGSNNTIIIGSKSNLNYLSLYIEDDCGKIKIGEHVTITGTTNIDVIEGKSVTIGNDCLFSSDIYFRTGDSHSIFDMTSRQRINPSQNIVVGDHVWIGHFVKVLKGSVIGNNSIVGTGAIVTSSFPSHVVLGGVPAKVLKSEIDWTPHRLPIK